MKVTAKRTIKGVYGRVAPGEVFDFPDERRAKVLMERGVIEAPKEKTASKKKSEN